MTAIHVEGWYGFDSFDEGVIDCEIEVSDNLAAKLFKVLEHFGEDELVSILNDEEEEYGLTKKQKKELETVLEELMDSLLLDEEEIPEGASPSMTVHMHLTESDE
ncbi:MAG: hypothetical protein IJU20_01620 [Clostridia bacterium]|nr:hypothetical protein [Clostridia bacterium]